MDTIRNVETVPPRAAANLPAAVTNNAVAAEFADTEQP